MSKTCPFNENKNCSNECPLYISPNDLNEFVTARLGSIGVIDKKEGGCSFRILALSQSRMIFESTNTRG